MTAQVHPMANASPDESNAVARDRRGGPGETRARGRLAGLQAGHPGESGQIGRPCVADNPWIPAGQPIRGAPRDGRRVRNAGVPGLIRSSWFGRSAASRPTGAGPVFRLRVLGRRTGIGAAGEFAWFLGFGPSQPAGCPGFFLTGAPRQAESRYCGLIEGLVLGKGLILGSACLRLQNAWSIVVCQDASRCQLLISALLHVLASTRPKVLGHAPCLATAKG